MKNIRNIFFICKHSFLSCQKIIYFFTGSWFILVIFILLLRNISEIGFPAEQKTYWYNWFNFMSKSNSNKKGFIGSSYYLNNIIYNTPGLVFYGLISFTLLFLIVILDIETGRINYFLSLKMSRRTIIMAKVFTIIIINIIIMIFQFILVVVVLKIASDNFLARNIYRIFLSSLNMLFIVIFVNMLLLGIYFINSKKLNIIIFGTSIFLTIFFIYILNEIVIILNIENNKLDFLQKIDLDGYMFLPAKCDFTIEHAKKQNNYILFAFMRIDYLKFWLSSSIFFGLGLGLFGFCIYKFNNLNFNI
ncbi:hypothetical protein [Spiroplasma endosymbiont of Aspidapion aeneum]|uniref:hypothetical protein n=1 Tax=Spiroplasma endosymbiont of Aspidapion aeneum TaxID=3066276 RepID=UPI00313ECCBC